MKKNYLLFISILITLVLGCSEDLIDSEGTGTLKGTVRVEKTNEPMENVKITTSPSTETVYSDEEGKFDIFESIPIGEYSVRIEKKGYVTEFEAIEIQKFGQVVTIAVEMITDETLNDPPTTPELISPEDGAKDLPREVLLKWSSSDPDGDPITYKVILSDASNQTLKEYNDLTVDTLSIKGLRFGTSYTWQVAASDSLHKEVYSKSSQFSIRKDPEYRYHYVKEENGNFVIWSSNLKDSIPITTRTTSSWRPHKNNIAQKVAFLQTLGGQTHLVTAELNGDRVHRVSQVPLNGFRDDELDFAWHTDGSEFIYPSFQKLYRVNADGTGQHLIYETGDGSLITKVAWSDDGSKIAIVTNDKEGYDAAIRILDATTGRELETILENEKGAVRGIDWNITGDKLVYAYDVSGYQSSDYRQLDMHLFMHDFSSGEATDLSDNKPAGTNDYDPRFSPNDAEIIFTNANNDQRSGSSIYIMDAENGGNSRESLIEAGAMPDYE